MADLSDLVPTSFTPREVAMLSAGIVTLRRFWAQRSVDASMGGMEKELQESLDTIRECTALFDRLESLLSNEQRQTLFNEMMENKLKDR